MIVDLYIRLGINKQIALFISVITVLYNFIESIFDSYIHTTEVFNSTLDPVDE